jgi:hypothetical protein
MGSLNSTIKKTGLSSSDGTAELTSRSLNQQTKHQLTLVPAAGATGTVPVKFRAKGSTVEEVLYKADGVTAVTGDLSAPGTVVFPTDNAIAVIDAVLLDCSGVTGDFDAILESR